MRRCWNSSGPWTDCATPSTGLSSVIPTFEQGGSDKDVVTGLIAVSKALHRAGFCDHRRRTARLRDWRVHFARGCTREPTGRRTGGAVPAPGLKHHRQRKGISQCVEQCSAGRAARPPGQDAACMSTLFAARSRRELVRRSPEGRGHCPARDGGSAGAALAYRSAWPRPATTRTGTRLSQRSYRPLIRRDRRSSGSAAAPDVRRSW